jgi:hypothetical protein
MIRSLLVVGAALSLSACFAAQPMPESRPALISDRPDFTEATAIVDPKRVQVEMGQTITRDGTLRETTVGEVLIRAGLADGIELRVSPNSWLRASEGGTVTSGLQDANIGFKIRLLEGSEDPSWRPELSVITHTTVPTGAAAFRAPRLQPEIKLLAAWPLSERVALSSNVNVSRPVDGGRAFTEYAGSLSLGVAMNDRVAGYIEGFGFAPQDGSDTVNRYLNGGFTYLLSPDVQFDIRAGVGPTRSLSKTHFYGIGLVVRR